jgi:predicted lipid-binding transport protein (Tim44 family)
MKSFKEADVVSVFTDRTEAEKARDELLRAGFQNEQIELVLPEHQATSDRSEARPKLKEKGGAALGGLVGAAIGGLLGTLAATGVVPGVPAILGGDGLAGVVGLIAGAVIGGFLGAVIGWAFEADEDSFYARELQQGRTLMTVHHCNGRSAEAATILRQNQASAVRTVSDQRPIERSSAPTAEPSA